MTLQAAASWLKSVSVITALSGIPLLLGAIPGLDGFANLFVDFVFYPLDGNPRIASPDARLLMAICGGLTAGIAVMIWMVVDKVYTHDPAAARSIILTGLGTWCALDSLGSLAAGAPINAAVNLLILGAFAWPLRASIVAHKQS